MTELTKKHLLQEERLSLEEIKAFKLTSNFVPLIENMSFEQFKDVVLSDPPTHIKMMYTELFPDREDDIKNYMERCSPKDIEAFEKVSLEILLNHVKGIYDYIEERYSFTRAVKQLMKENDEDYEEVEYLTQQDLAESIAEDKKCLDQ